MKKLLLFLIIALPAFVYSQNTLLSGTIADQETSVPAGNLPFNIVAEDSKTYSGVTDASGDFSVEIPEGKYTLSFNTNNTNFSLGPYDVSGAKQRLGVVLFSPIHNDDDKTNIENIPVLSLSETDMKESGGQNISTALNAARDPFVSTASFIFSAARFKIRGYDNENFTTYMNGIPVNDLEDGGTFWGQWGGLNSVMYSRETTIGLTPTTFTYGALGGAYSIDSRASKQRKQIQVNYATTNRNYRHRLMATYSTGMLKHGWAVSVSATKRWANEGYVKGTYYDGYSYFVSIEKLFTNKHSLSLTAMGAPTRNGRQGAAVQEMYDIAGSNYYNPNWGYQNGKVRNASEGNTHQPLFILMHEFKINNRSTLVSSAGFSFGKRSTTALDWNNAPDPRPDYYRYLPSYINDPVAAAAAEKELRDNEALRQINWGGLYEANYMSTDSVRNANGIQGNTVSGKRARYIIENRVEDTKKFDFSSVYNNTFSDHISLNAGLVYQWQQSQTYKEVKDLLGADFYVDVNQFAERDFPDSFSVYQNDLNNPSRILKVGDKWGYNFTKNIHKASAFVQPQFKFNNVDFFVGAELSYTGFWRNGKNRNGQFPENSFGKSEVKNFINYAIKGGLSYKINGRNYLYANGSYLTRAPYFENSFVSVRTRNQYADNLKSENIYTVEAGYQLMSPKVRLKANFFYTQFNNQTKTMSFFHDDLRTLVNYTQTGIDTRHIGGEFGMEAKVYRGFSLTAVASVGRYTYTNRPQAIITQDNSSTELSRETIYAKNFNVSGTPQMAYSVGINYRAPQFWFLTLNLNYYDWMWLDFNPARRTIAATDLEEPGTTQYDNIVKQQRLKGQFTMDLFAGYSWLMNNQIKSLKKRMFLVFNVGISNITNNRKFVTGGYEQLRFDFNEKNPDKFPPKYFYAYGTTYFVSVSYRINQ
jgi:hypothetical protein